MTAEREMSILDAEIVETPPIDLDKLLDPQLLQHPPAVTEVCTCGNATDLGHGGRTCDEVRAIRARVEFGQLPRRERLRARLRGCTPAGWPR